jgi:hypothetical protein
MGQYQSSPRSESREPLLRKLVSLPDLEPDTEAAVLRMLQCPESMGSTGLPATQFPQVTVGGRRQGRVLAPSTVRSHVRCWTTVFLGFFSATPLLAQELQRPVRIELDSGTVVRLHWFDGPEQARLVAPFAWDSAVMRYCRYPSPVCGDSTLNQPRVRSVQNLACLNVRRGSRTGRGALIGAGIGVLGGLVVLVGQGVSDAPALSTGRQVLTVAALAGIWSALGALTGAAADNWETTPSDFRGSEQPDLRCSRPGARCCAGVGVRSRS